MLTDEEIGAFLRSKGHADSEQTVLQFKWREVITFMEANPHVLLQLLDEPTAPLPQHAQTPSAAASRAQFERRHIKNLRSSDPRQANMLQALQMTAAHAKSPAALARASLSPPVNDSDYFVTRASMPLNPIAAKLSKRGRRDLYLTQNRSRSKEAEEGVGSSMEAHKRRKGKMSHRRAKLAHRDVKGMS